MAKIFISYSSDDKTAIQDVSNDLTSMEHDIWFDHELVGGQSWWNKILKEIEHCDFYLCALSNAYLKSDACKRELSYANALGKTIIPIKVVNDFDSRFLPPEISKLQITDVESGNKKGVLALISALNTIPPSTNLPDTLPEPPAIPVSYLSELLLSINSNDSLNQDEQAALIFKLRDHYRSSGDASGVMQALEKFEARKDLLATIGREADTLKTEIHQASSQPVSAHESPTEGQPKTETETVPVFRKFNSVDEVKGDLKDAINTGKTDGAAFGFGVISFLFPIIGIVLFFVWRKDKPKRAKLISWAAAIGFVFYLILMSEDGYYY